MENFKKFDNSASHRLFTTTELAPRSLLVSLIFSGSHSPFATFKHRRNDTSIYCGFTTGTARLPVLTMHKGGGA